MDRFDIQKLRDLPIEGVAERLGLNVSRHKSLCPFHADRHPSLTFNTRRNTFRCFVCNAHGGVIDLAMHVLGKNFTDTCRWLADGTNIILSTWKPALKDHEHPATPFTPERYAGYFKHPHLNGAAVRFLFQERKIDLRVVNWCRLNSYRDTRGVNWLQIPYYDQEGKLVGIQMRNLDYAHPHDGQQTAEATPGPRFRFPYGSQCTLCNQPILAMLKPHEPLYIAEGCSDCWSLLSAGHKAIAIPSATLLMPRDILTLKTALTARETPLHMYPDADPPGERLYTRLLQLANELRLTLIRHSLPPACKDFSEYYLQTINLQNPSQP